MRIFFDEIITQYRLTQNATSSTEEYQHIGSITGSIKPAKADDIMLSDGVPYETYKLYCEDYTDIREGDKLTSVPISSVDYKNIQGTDINNDTTDDEYNITVKTTKEFVVKNVRRYGFKNIQRVECYLTLLKQ